MEMSTKHIINPNLVVFCFDLEEAFKEGYRIDPENPVGQWGVCYEVVLIKDDVQEAFVTNVVTDLVVPLEVVRETVKRVGRPSKQ
jgi:hypothetical protein